MAFKGRSSGAAGSYPMAHVSILLLVVLLSSCSRVLASPADTAAAMQSRKYGLMVHFLGGDSADPKGAVAWNSIANTFDANGLAQDAADAGAGWLLLTLGQNDGYWLAPNPVYDRYVNQYSPSRCATRNVVNDLAAALAQHDIKLWIYIPSQCCGNDVTASNDLAFGEGQPRMAEFQNRWNQVIAQWGNEWGPNVVAVFLDGVYTPAAMYEFSDSPNFDDLANACRAGNTDRALMFNTGNPPPFTVTDDDTLIAGELYNQSYPLPPCPGRFVTATDPISGQSYQVQWHLTTYLAGNFAGNGVPDAPRFSNDDVINYMLGVFANGGMITWDVPIQVGGPQNGRLKPGLKPQLAAIKACVRNGVCDAAITGAPTSLPVTSPPVTVTSPPVTVTSPPVTSSPVTSPPVTSSPTPSPSTAAPVKPQAAAGLHPQPTQASPAGGCSFLTPANAECPYQQGFTTCYNVDYLGLVSGSLNGVSVGPYCCFEGCSSQCYPRDSTGRPGCSSTAVANLAAKPVTCPSYPTAAGALCPYQSGATTCYDVPALSLISGKINGQQVGPYCCQGGCTNQCYPRDAAGRHGCP